MFVPVDSTAYFSRLCLQFAGFALDLVPVLLAHAFLSSPGQCHLHFWYIKSISLHRLPMEMPKSCSQQWMSSFFWTNKRRWWDTQGMSEELVKLWKGDIEWLWQGKLFQVKTTPRDHDSSHHKLATNLLPSTVKLYLQKVSYLTEVRWFSVGITSNTFIRQRATLLSA